MNRNALGRGGLRFSVALRAGAAGTFSPITDSEYESSGDSLFYAVERFGPGPARVTGNADNGTIDTVLFHDKKYALGSETDNVIGGPVVALLGALGIAYAFRHRERLRRSVPPA